MRPEMADLIHSIYSVQRQIWQEANQRRDLNHDALLHLWEALETVNNEVGECSHRYAAERDDNVISGLRRLEAQARQELQHVRKGVRNH